MAEDEAPDRAEGLLEQIADTALDDDYYVVRAKDRPSAREFNTVLTALALAAFALLVTIAALQTRSDRPASEREREQLISDVAARKELQASRQETEARLRAEVERLSAAVGGYDPAHENLRVLAADAAASGPGVTVVVGPSTQGNADGEITDDDLQLLVNGLWYAGAEAIAVNGNRVGTLTAIHSANGVININYRDIGPPYSVVALGSPDSLQQRFEDNPAGRYWAARQADAAVQFGMTPSSDLSVAAAPRGRVTIRHATAIEGEK